jgi:hypothetical protein
LVESWIATLLALDAASDTFVVIWADKSWCRSHSLIFFFLFFVFVWYPKQRHPINDRAFRPRSSLNLSSISLAFPLWRYLKEASHQGWHRPLSLGCVPKILNEMDAMMAGPPPSDSPHDNCSSRRIVDWFSNENDWTDGRSTDSYKGRTDGRSIDPGSGRWTGTSTTSR